VQNSARNTGQKVTRKEPKAMQRLIQQIFKFGVIGALAFLIDYGVLYVLTEYAGMYYLLSGAISFTVSVIFNYICSMKYVFSGKEGMSRRKEFIVFVVLSILGLLLNQLLMWLGVDLLHIYYMVTKIFATAIVMVYNFVTRKIFLEEHS
jgi:putative flippase GtrA